MLCNFSKNHMLETIFEKSHRSSVILKIVEASPQLVQNLTPIRNLFCTFLFICCCYPYPPHLIYLKLKKIKGSKMDSLSLSLFTSLSLSQARKEEVDSGDGSALYE